MIRCPSISVVMCAVVREESLDDFLVRQWNESSPHDLCEPLYRFCLLSGDIVERNLKRTVTQQGVPASQVARYGTIEDIASGILREHHGRPPTIIDGKLRQRAIRKVIEDAKHGRLSGGEASSELRQLAVQIDWRDEEYETIESELNRYYRATDAGSAADQCALETVAQSLPDKFGRHLRERGLAAFRALDRELRSSADLPDHTYLTRHHVLSAARNNIKLWDEAFAELEWVGVSTVNIFDNPVLRLERPRSFELSIY